MHDTGDQKGTGRRAVDRRIGRRAFLEKLGLAGVLAAALLLPLGCVPEEDDEDEEDD